MEAAKGGSHTLRTPPFAPVLCQVGEGDLVCDNSNGDIQTSPQPGSTGNTALAQPLAIFILR